MRSHPKPRVLVVGSLNQDLVLRMDRMPTSGENRIGSQFLEVNGGKGGNQAVASARLGGDVTLCSCVGPDAAGAALLTSLQNAAVLTQDVIISETQPTGRAFIFVEQDGQNRIVVYPGANQDLRAAHIERVFHHAKFDAVLLNLEIAHEAIEATIRLAAQQEIPVILDAGPAQAFDLKKLRGVAVLSPNETEAAALTGNPCQTLEEIRAAAIRLRKETGAHEVVIKLGARGALVCDDVGTDFFPAFKIEATDATAAGDAFTSGLALEWLRTRSIRAALPFAQAAGAITATRLGAQVSLPDETEVRTFLEARLSSLKYQPT